MTFKELKHILSRNELNRLNADHVRNNMCQRSQNDMSIALHCTSGRHSIHLGNTADRVRCLRINTLVKFMKILWSGSNLVHNLFNLNWKLPTYFLPS